MLRISTGRGPRPTGGGFETFSWYYFRVSGVILILLVIAHMTIMHVTNDVACTTYSFVAARWINPFWRLFDWLLLVLALTHGMNGLRIVVDDYIRSSTTRTWIMSIIGVLLVAFLMLGTITLVTFNPVPKAEQGVECVRDV